MTLVQGVTYKEVPEEHKRSVEDAHMMGPYVTPQLSELLNRVPGCQCMHLSASRFCGLGARLRQVPARCRQAGKLVLDKVRDYQT